MPQFKYQAGINSVGSYQVSGMPWVSGSTTLAPGIEERYIFPTVAKTVLVVNESNQDIRVHYNSTGSGNVVSGRHYATLTVTRDSIELGLKCKEIYISAPSSNGGNASYAIVADLTGISTSEMYTLTGSGLTE